LPWFSEKEENETKKEIKNEKKNKEKRTEERTKETYRATLVEHSGWRCCTVLYFGNGRV
jgi:hypothetical protein